MFDPIIAERIRERLVRFRREVGLTQDEVAARLGTTPVTYKRYEQGERAIESTTLVRIAQELGRTIDHFTMPDEPPPGKAVPVSVLFKINLPPGSSPELQAAVERIRREVISSVERQLSELEALRRLRDHDE